MVSDTDRPLPSAYASLDISGDSLYPEFWTRYFAIRPDMSIVKGQPYTTRSGKVSKILERTGIWSYSSENHITSDDLDVHILYLIYLFGLPRPDLKSLLQQKNVTMRIFCYFDNEFNRDKTATIGHHIIQIIEKCGGIIDIDEYRFD